MDPIIVSGFFIGAFSVLLGLFGLYMIIVVNPTESITDNEMSYLKETLSGLGVENAIDFIYLKNRSFSRVDLSKPVPKEQRPVVIPLVNRNVFVTPEQLEAFRAYIIQLPFEPKPTEISLIKELVNINVLPLDLLHEGTESMKDGDVISLVREGPKVSKETLLGIIHHYAFMATSPQATEVLNKRCEYTDDEHVMALAQERKSTVIQMRVKKGSKPTYADHEVAIAYHLAQLSKLNPAPLPLKGEEALRFVHFLGMKSKNDIKQILDDTHTTNYDQILTITVSGVDLHFEVGTIRPCMLEAIKAQKPGTIRIDSVTNPKDEESVSFALGENPVSLIREYEPRVSNAPRGWYLSIGPYEIATAAIVGHIKLVVAKKVAKDINVPEATVLHDQLGFDPNRQLTFCEKLGALIDGRDDNDIIEIGRGSIAAHCFVTAAAIKDLIDHTKATMIIRSGNPDGHVWLDESPLGVKSLAGAREKLHEAELKYGGDRKILIGVVGKSRDFIITTEFLEEYYTTKIKQLEAAVASSSAP